MVHQSDVLVIGSGIAGCVCALDLADAGIGVTLVTRAALPEESNTLYAQGGIVYQGVGDSPDLLRDDILRAGAGSCNPRAVDILVHEGPALVRRMLVDRVQVPFDRTSDDDISIVREGGHSLDRIAHVADATGQAIERSLVDALRRHPKITWLLGHTAIDLLTPAHHDRNRRSVYDPLSCVGAYVLDQSTGTVVRCLAGAVVLATGGIGQVYLRTTNPAGARGDGLAMAHRAGARVINCEFVQFHPTAFYQPHGPCFLISEAVRGAGARLVHADGQPFMQRYEPEWKDLAPRDVVARSIHREMLDRGVPNVFLDVRSHLAPDQIRERFPTLVQGCTASGLDCTRDLIPVVPAAHYFCGGVWVDEWSATTVRNLYAVGEVSCTGLHGANRLASTSLLEGLVWGARAARRIRETLPSVPRPLPEGIPDWVETGTEAPDPALISQDFSQIKHIMWNYVGLSRSSHRLQRALRELRNLQHESERFYQAVRLSDELIGLRNAVRSSLLVAEAAWENKTSVGCHYRES